MSTRKDNKLNYRLFRDTLEIEGDLTFHQVAGFLQYYNQELYRYSGHVLIFNLDGLELLDSGGVTAIHYVRDKLSDSGVEVQITGVIKTSGRNWRSSHIKAVMRKTRKTS